MHEVLIQNNDKGSVITWDFDVMKHDLVFTVFRSKEILPCKLSVTGNSAISADPVQYTSIGKCWKEGVDYFRVEAPIVCHDGESIQGSHVTNTHGSFILQWSYFDRSSITGSSGGTQDMWGTITHPQHKAKVMYYYEVLNSLDYRGSMTSLQSTQSCFSNISKVSGQQSTSGVSSGVSSLISETTTRNLDVHES